MLAAVTTYYNPCKYQHRLQNFHTFRDALNIPLLVMEVSFDGNFQLSSDDADYVVQLHSGDLMWQKERLINLSLDYLPEQFQQIAWIDCDLVFVDPEWSRKTEDELSRSQIVQLFSDVVMLGRNISIEHCQINRQNLMEKKLVESLRSYARFVNESASKSIQIESLSDCKISGYSPGFAWAMSRPLLSQLRLYDTMVLGAGDIMMAQAAFGWQEEVIAVYDLSTAQKQQYLDWSVRFHEAIQGQVGWLDQTIYHLWHGELKDRQYQSRYENFSRFGFDPEQDLISDPKNGCWRWKRRNEKLCDYITNFFSLRYEDGVPSVSTGDRLSSAFKPN